jgi:hypothetical protein
VYQEDYILRLVQQLAAFAAQIAGLSQKGEYDEALAAADQAWGKLLEDTPRALIDAVDTPTLAGMLREPAKIRAAAQLFVEEGRALAGKGDSQRAAARFRRAMELIFEARTLDPLGDSPAPRDAASPVGPSKLGPNRSDASRPGPSRPGLNIPALSKPELVTQGLSKPDPSTPDPSKPDPSKQPPSKQDDVLLRELSRVVPVETLDPRYRART